MSDTPLRMASLREIAEELARRVREQDGPPSHVQQHRERRAASVDPDTGGRITGRRDQKGGRRA